MMIVSFGRHKYQTHFRLDRCCRLGRRGASIYLNSLYDSCRSCGRVSISRWFIFGQEDQCQFSDVHISSLGDSWSWCSSDDRMLRFGSFTGVKPHPVLQRHCQTEISEVFTFWISSSSSSSSKAFLSSKINCKTSSADNLWVILISCDSWTPTAKPHSIPHLQVGSGRFLFCRRGCELCENVRAEDVGSLSFNKSASLCEGGPEKTIRSPRKDGYCVPGLSWTELLFFGTQRRLSRRCCQEKVVFETLIFCFWRSPGDHSEQVRGHGGGTNRLHGGQIFAGGGRLKGRTTELS